MKILSAALKSLMNIFGRTLSLDVDFTRMEGRQAAAPKLGIVEVSAQIYFRREFIFAANLFSPRIYFRREFIFAANLFSPRIYLRREFIFVANLFSPRIFFCREFIFAASLFVCL
jgi:hypothetical protein